MDINKLTEQYMIELSVFTDHQMKLFLDKHLIPYTNPQETLELLRKKGMRLLDEVETLPNGDKVHKLLLLNVIDEYNYTIKYPVFKEER